METWAEDANLLWNVCPPPQNMMFPIKGNDEKVDETSVLTFIIAPAVYISLSLFLAFFVFWANYNLCKKVRAFWFFCLYILILCKITR